MHIWAVPSQTLIYALHMYENNVWAEVFRFPYSEFVRLNSECGPERGIDQNQGVFSLGTLQ